MKLRFSKEDLFRHLQMLEGTVPNRGNTLPILSNLLITATDTVIEITATDLEVAVRVVVPGTIEEPGDITISARKLFEIVRELPPEEITMTTTANDRLQLACGEGVYKVIGLPSDEFPEIPTVEDVKFSMDSDDLCQMMERVAFCASTEDTRVILNGVHLNLDHERTDFVATDGRRMAASFHAPLLSEGADPVSIILPLKAVSRIPKLFADSMDVNIGLNNNQIVFSDAEATLSSRLIEGDYPNYKGLLPELDDYSTVSFSASSSLASLRRVSLLSNPKTYAIRMDIEGLMAWFSSQTPDLGEAREGMEVTGGQGELQVAFDARFMREAIASIDSDNFRLQFKDGQTALLIKPASDDNHLCLIMPMRLEDNG